MSRRISSCLFSMQQTKLLGRSAPFALLLLIGNGDGTSLMPQAFVTGGLTRAPAVADLNGDGKPDIATADTLRNQISVLLHR